MEGLGYITLADAEKLTGIKAEALKKRCQEGQISGAVKQGKVWFVPKSELIKVPAPSRDIFLNGLIFAANRGIEVPITLFVNGTQLGGWLTNIKSYVEQLDKDLFEGLQSATLDGTGEKNESPEADNRRLVEALLKSPADQDKSYDELYGDRSKDPVYYDFCYLKKACKYDGHHIEQLGDKIMRIKVGSIDAYQFGLRGTSDESS